MSSAATSGASDEKELSNCPTVPVKQSSTPAAHVALTEQEDGAEGKDEEGSQRTPSLPLLDPSTVSLSSSASSSPSSSITTDTSVASDTSRGVPSSDKHAQEKHKVEKRAPGLNDDTIMSTMDPNADADHKGIDVVTITSTPAPLPPTPASSSSTSLPGPTPLNSSTTTSTSPSTTNVNDQGVDSKGLTSLLRPRLLISQNLNVKFAPLPELAPRKRKSSTPLGMAARSQLARRRRMIYRDSYDDDGTYEESYRPRRFHAPETQEDEETEGVDGVRESNMKKKKSKKKKEGEGEKQKKPIDGEQSDDEDPLAALAKKMGRAGKQLWKKMANGGKGEKDEAGDDARRLKMEPVVVIGTTTGEPEGGREGDFWTEEVGREYREIQEMSVKGSIEIEPTLRQAASTPLPPSEPPSPTDTTPPATSHASPQENGFLTMPTIVVSAA